MRDVDIRAQLRADLEGRFAHDPETLIVDELGVDEGSFRIDVAIVNGALHGYEIKSERDTLTRLPAQAGAYRGVFDQLTAIAAERHVDRVAALVPAWWGIVVPVRRDDAIDLETRREPRTNPHVDPRALAALLWRDEAIAALERRQLATGLRSKPRRQLWDVLAAELELDELRRLVRDQLRARPAWRVDPSRASRGA